MENTTINLKSFWYCKYNELILIWINNVKPITIHSNAFRWLTHHVSGKFSFNEACNATNIIWRICCRSLISDTLSNKPCFQTYIGKDINLDLPKCIILYYDEYWVYEFKLFQETFSQFWSPTFIDLINTWQSIYVYTFLEMCAHFTIVFLCWKWILSSTKIYFWPN